MFHECRCIGIWDGPGLVFRGTYPLLVYPRRTLELRPGMYIGVCLSIGMQQRITHRQGSLEPCRPDLDRRTA